MVLLRLAAINAACFIAATLPPNTLGRVLATLTYQRSIYDLT